MKARKVLLVWVLIWLSVSLFAQKIAFQINRDTLKIGEQLEFRLEIFADSASGIKLPDKSDYRPFELVRQSVDTVKNPYGLIVKNFLTAWDSGHYVVPAVPIRIGDSIFKTDSLKVTVLGVPVDTTKQGLYPVKPAWETDLKNNIKISEKKSRFLGWIVLGLLIIGVFLFRYFLKKKKEAVRAKRLSPYEKAQAELEDILKEKWHLHNPDLFYVRLTDTLRNYLENALKLPAKERVSPVLIELLEDFRFENHEPINSERIAELKEMLHRADMAKFAKNEPAPVYREKDLSFVRSFIDELQRVLDKIAEEKQKAELEKLAIEKKEKRKIQIFRLAITGLLAVLLGMALYYFFKPQIKQWYQKSMSVMYRIPPESQWKPVSIGSAPSVVFISPVVPQAVETYYPAENLMSNLDEFAMLKSGVGNWKLYVFVFDGKKELPKDLVLNEIQRVLEKEYEEPVQINLREDGIITGAAKPESGRMKIYGKYFSDGSRVRVVLTEYTGENALWKSVSEKVIVSSGLKN